MGLAAGPADESGAISSPEHGPDSQRDEGIHNPYWQLPELQSKLRPSNSTCQLERRSQRITLPRERHKDKVGMADGETGGDVFMIGGNWDAEAADRDMQRLSSTDTGLTSRDGGSGNGLRNGSSNNRSGRNGKPRARSRDAAESFVFEEMHDCLAGDLFYSTYFVKTR
jgi:hypothetical protein